jgi:hypothetical protein
MTANLAANVCGEAPPLPGQQAVGAGRVNELKRQISTPTVRPPVWTYTLLMRGAIFAIFLVSATAAHPQSNQSDAMMARCKKAQTYASEGFQPISCFAGQAKVEGKRLSRQPFSLFASDQDRKCCGTLVKSGRTDQHGHFLVEPLPEGRYVGKFNFNGSDFLISVAVVQSYERCDGTHLEINFSRTGKDTVQNYIDINDSGEDCQEYEPYCYRK